MPSPYIESTDITHTNNTSTSTLSKAISYPAHLTGDLLIMALASDADVSHTPPANGPNGETINVIADDIDPGSNGPHLSIVWWISAGDENAGTLTWTLSGNETCSAECILIPNGEYYSTTPIGTIGGAGSSDADAANATMPAFTPNRSDGRVVAIGACDADPMANPYAPAGWTGISGAARDDGAQNIFVATRNSLSVASTEVAAAAFDINATDSYSCIGFVINGTPTPGTVVDLYIDWHTGSDGNAVTDAIAAGSCRPTTPADTVEAYPGATLTAMFIETDSASPVAGLVNAAGVGYDFDDTTQGAIYDHTGNYEDLLTANVTSAPNVMSMGHMMKTSLDDIDEWHALSGIVGTGEWALLAPRYFDGAQHFYMHTSLGYSAAPVVVANNTWYWVTIQYNATAGFGYLAVYNPSTWAQVGSTVSLAFDASPSGVAYWAIGQHASQGNTEVAYTWYGPAIFDWTTGAFPLLPAQESAYSNLVLSII